MFSLFFYDSDDTAKTILARNIAIIPFDPLAIRLETNVTCPITYSNQTLSIAAC
jgi:hypothetical protein